jgi:hypothetical protein
LVRTHIQGIEIPSVANAPFSAKEVVTWDEPLIGGGSVARTYYTLVARDSQGRVRRETREFVPAGSKTEPALRSFTILDPVAGVRTVCTQATMNCATSSFTARTVLSNSSLANSSGKNQTSLGTQTIAGLNVVGTREMATDIAGTNRSSRVALTYTDKWYSPDLQMDLSVIRNNPQFGQVTLYVTNIARGEPARSMFAVPTGYQVGSVQR